MSRITGRLAKLLRLRPVDWLFLFEACLLVPAAHLVIRWVPIRTWARWLRDSRRGGDGRVPLQRVSRAFHIAERVIPGSTCLVLALGAGLLLRMLGCGARLQVGVTRRANGELLAHAWVISAGQVVVGDIPELADYRVFPLTEAGQLWGAGDWG